jgi:NADH-quinone oxidoreductase subunit A
VILDSPLALILFLLFAAANFGGMIAFTAVVGPKRRNPVKDEPFECGSVPTAPHPGRVHVRFNRVAMFFIVFDIETVMMLPWVTIYRTELRGYGLAVMAAFLFMLLFGLAYAWKRGGLEWD